MYKIFRLFFRLKLDMGFSILDAVNFSSQNFDVKKIFFFIVSFIITAHFLPLIIYVYFFYGMCCILRFQCVATTRGIRGRKYRTRRRCSSCALAIIYFSHTLARTMSIRSPPRLQFSSVALMYAFLSAKQSFRSSRAIHKQTCARAPFAEINGCGAAAANVRGHRHRS